MADRTEAEFRRGWAAVITQRIKAAKAGDTDAARELIRDCADGLEAGRLSLPLVDYLAGCLREYVDGVPIARALCVEEGRPIGRPADPFPDWAEPLAALAEMLRRKGHKPEAINRAMSDARVETGGKPLDRVQAQRIRKDYSPMKDVSEDILIHLCILGKVATFIRELKPQT